MDHNYSLHDCRSCYRVFGTHYMSSFLASHQHLLGATCSRPDTLTGQLLDPFAPRPKASGVAKAETTSQV